MRRFSRKKAGDCGAGDWLPFTVGFPGDAVVKNPSANAGEVREAWLDPWVEKIAWRKK